jgi:LmbE family N-acetylglucosaminyl deacetylase
VRALTLGGSGRRHILCLGAHCDDIEIGCGGSLLHWTATADAQIDVTWVAFSATPTREQELRRSAAQFLARAHRAEVIVHAFRDGHFPAQFTAIKAAFEALKQLDAPDLILTHELGDRHQDHRLIAEMTRNTFRDHLILGYEIMKFEGGLTTPTLYVPIEPALAQRKAELLMDCYESQRGRRWFTPDTFLSLMRLRGIESGGPHAHAEGFHASKLLLE